MEETIDVSNSHSSFVTILYLKFKEMNEMIALTEMNVIDRQDNINLSESEIKEFSQMSFSIFLLIFEDVWY